MNWTALILTFWVMFVPLVSGEASLQPQSSKIDELAEYKVPKGWYVTRYDDWKDPMIELWQKFSFIRIRLYGGKDSSYKTVEDFMGSFAPPSWNGPTREIGPAIVAGVKTTMYRRRITLVGDPYGRVPKSAFPTVDEEFCVVPVRDQFFVLTYSCEPPLENPLPPLDLEGEKKWKVFLKSFKI